MQAIDHDVSYSLPGSLEDTDLANRDLDRINGQLKKINDRLDGLEANLPPIKPQGWPARKWQWTKANKTTLLPVTAIIIAIVGWPASALIRYYIDHKDDGFNHAVDARIDTSSLLKEMNGKLTETREGIKTVQTTLDTLQPFIAGLVRHEMDTAAAKPHAELRNNLPFVRDAIAVARIQNLPIDPETIKALGAKLSAVSETAPGYWPTTAEFISYRSQLIVSDPQSLTQPNLPDCRDQEPGGMRVEKLTPLPDAKTSVQFANAKFSNCRVTLDSPQDAEKFNAILRYKAVRITFTHCLIIYDGGPIGFIMEFRNDPRFVTAYDQSGELKIGPATFSGLTLEFVNCLLNFAAIGQPQPDGRKLTETLLAQNGPTLTLR